MVNKVILVGNLGRDPEVRATSGGQPVASLRIGQDKQTGQDRYRVKVVADSVRFLGGGQRSAGPRAVPDDMGASPLNADVGSPALQGAEDAPGGDNGGHIGPSALDVPF